MTDLTDRSLREAARLYGVGIVSRDLDGVPRQASPEVLLPVLQALGAPVTRTADAAEAVRVRRLEAWRRLVPPVVVVESDSSPAVLPVRSLTAEAPRRLTWTLRIECGRVCSGRVRLADLPLIRGGRIEGRDREVRQLLIRGPLPPGYHRLELKLGLRQASCLLVAAPPTGWGAERLDLEWGEPQQLVSMLLNAPGDPDPSRPDSRLFWNELLVDPATAPELEYSPAARAMLVERRDELAGLGKAPLFDLQRLAAVRHAIMYSLARSFFEGGGATRPAFLKFLADSPGVGDFARFRARRGAEHDPDPWIASMHIYAQWRFTRQIQEARSRASGTGLCLEFPVGVHPDGYDVWRNSSLFAAGMSVGIPPGPSAAEGQVLEVPPMLPDRMRENQFRYLRATLATSMAPAGLLRFGHAMFIQRLYWVPEGSPAGMGVNVAYPAEEVSAVIRLESHRAQCEVVGEDPDAATEEVRALMDRCGLPTTTDRVGGRGVSPLAIAGPESDDSVSEKFLAFDVAGRTAPGEDE